MAEEILSRVPLKSMRAVRLTCKKWDTLSKSRSFTKMHAAMEGNWLIVLMDYKLYLTRSGVVNGDPYIEPQGHNFKISQVFQCEGLLLCILKDTSRIVVWNPYWGQTRWIEPRCSYSDRQEYSYALGYFKNNKSLGSHKILRFIDDDYLCPTKSKHHFSWYEIYDLDTRLWKTLDVTSPHWDISPEDLEMFGPLLPLPPLPGGLWGGELETLSCVREEKLAVFYQMYDDQGSHEIWITTKIEAEEVLWSKFLTLNMAFRSGDFYIDEEKRLAMVFDKASDEYRHTVNIIGEDGYFRELDLHEDGSSSKLDVRASRKNYSWRTTVCSYVPSLLQIKKLSGGCQRKKQSSFELHRFHKKVSRLAVIGKRMK
ncbi:hypothetical protein EUTSA_v10017545mg [Eutrema salsugineum]|uniref:F-box associated beta-propeller type 1 domain-containing protein n=1 Tax=Eutrema salsugineum TaxID=72664 RepID=V4M5Y8_EUTSA|nr:hypothetical protein EUTSA_v10017545mg [Eutrema salsugineum]